MNLFRMTFVLALGLGAQPLRFEVASVRPTVPGANDTVNVGLRMDGQQAHISSFSLRDYVAMAYNVKAAQVTGPDWMKDARFDVNATVPPGTKTDQLGDMLQPLLAERFGLKFHREQKEFAVYAIVRGSKPLALKASTDVGGRMAR